MPRIRRPRFGSMQFWPRKRAKKEAARVRSSASSPEAQLLGFAGYKVGMTHAIVSDNRPNSPTKGEPNMCPLTVIECPPLKAISARFYKHSVDGARVVADVLADKLDKELGKVIILPKKVKKKIEEISSYDAIKIIVATQPQLTSIGKKKPQLFEVALGGKKDKQLAYAKNILGKEIQLTDIFSGGQQIDIHSLTTGKGYQGPVKRFGIGLRHHKSEKGRRGPGTLGGWVGQAHFMYRVAHAGQMGYQLRTEHNKQIMKIEDNVKAVNPKGGFINYGVVKNPCLLVKGGIIGPKKRLIRFTVARRPNKYIQKEAAPITYLSLASKQGV